MGKAWIGTSGYVYPHWRKGVFYPEGLPAREELAYYASNFHTVELNNPFYRFPTPANLERWRDATPPEFLFALKVNRTVSHTRRLRDVAAPLEEFVALASILGERLGPLLVQLPPDFQLDLPRLEEFVASLPDGYRWVVEFRHPSWQTPAVYDALARRGVALCVPVGGRIQPDLATTAAFTYIRVHSGIGGRGYLGEEGLRPWARRIRALLKKGKDVYVYFNNDRGGHAVRDAALLRRMLRADG